MAKNCDFCLCFLAISLKKLIFINFSLNFPFSRFSLPDPSLRPAQLLLRRSLIDHHIWWIARMVTILSRPRPPTRDILIIHRTKQNIRIEISKYQNIKIFILNSFYNSIDSICIKKFESTCEGLNIK